MQASRNLAAWPAALLIAALLAVLGAAIFYFGVGRGADLAAGELRDRVAKLEKEVIDLRASAAMKLTDPPPLASTPSQIIKQAIAEPASKEDVLGLVRAQNQRNKGYLEQSNRVLKELKIKHTEHEVFKRNIARHASMLSDQDAVISDHERRLRDLEEKPTYRRKGFFGGKP